MLRKIRSPLCLLLVLAALVAQAADEDAAPEEQESPTLRDPLPELAPPVEMEPPPDFSAEVPPPPPLSAPPAP